MYWVISDMKLLIITMLKIQLIGFKITRYSGINGIHQLILQNSMKLLNHEKTNMLSSHAYESDELNRTQLVTTEFVMTVC